MKVTHHLSTLLMWSFAVWLLLLPALQGWAASSYDRLIVSAAHRHELEPALVKAVVECESHFDPQAVSSRGAQGLMQLMPATQATLGVTDAFDPWHNIEAGVRYLASLQQTFGTHVSLLLAAYNAGPQAVIDAGYEVPPFAETQDYVSCVLSARQPSTRQESPSRMSWLQRPQCSPSPPYASHTPWHAWVSTSSCTSMSGMQVPRWPKAW
jgi:soluble lytic murein transglycosylase-like protein